MSSGYSRLSVLRALACSVLFVGCTGTVPDQNQTKRETGNDEPSQVPGGKSSGSVTQGNPGTIEGSVVRKGGKNTIPAFDTALVNDATLVAEGDRQRPSARIDVAGRRFVYDWHPRVGQRGRCFVGTRPDSPWRAARGRQLRQRSVL